MGGRLLYTIAEVAELLAISQRTVYRLIDAGDLETVRLSGPPGRTGPGTRIVAESVEAYVARLRRAADAGVSLGAAG